MLQKLMNILLVEDESAIAEPLCYALKKEGWSVHWVINGREAISYLKDNLVDFIILDVGLPDINGFDLCKEIRKNFDAPLLFLTARNDEIDKIIGLEIGADDYCTKPFSLRELISRIKVIYKRYSLIYQNSNVTNEPIKSEKKWMYNRDQQKIYYKNNLLNLTPIELKILLVFINNPNRIFTRENLMEKAWEYPEYSLIRTVDSHIKSIRNKLKKITVDEIIKTHRGFGYEMVD